MIGEVSSRPGKEYQGFDWGKVQGYLPSPQPRNQGKLQWS
jgi:hypothetical protein